jgi:hypothetical protein
LRRFPSATRMTEWQGHAYEKTEIADKNISGGNAEKLA